MDKSFENKRSNLYLSGLLVLAISAAYILVRFFPAIDKSRSPLSVVAEAGDVGDEPVALAAPESKRRDIEHEETGEHPRAVDFLKGHPNGDELRVVLEGMGKDVGELYAPKPFVETRPKLLDQFQNSGQIIESKLDAMVRWGPNWSADEISNQLKVNPSTLESPGVLEAVRFEADEHNAVIYHRTLEYFDSVNQAILLAEATREIRFAPFTTRILKPEKERGNVFYAASRGIDGWTAKLGLYANEHPDLVSSLKHITELIHVRDRTLKNIIREWN